MSTILIIIIVAAVIFGIAVFCFSNQSDPGERAKEAAGAAAGGAIFAGGCLVQLMIVAGAVLIGLWLLRLVFG